MIRAGASTVSTARPNAWTTSWYSVTPAALRATILYDQGIELQRDILKESSVTYVREDFDVEYEVYGMKWGSATDNPTDAQLATAANWGEDYDDPRQLKIVKGIFNASI